MYKSHGIKTDTARKLTGRDYVRELVRTRDKHTCQFCGKKWNNNSRRFDVHHLKGLCGKKSRGIDKISDIDSLITLCHKCHFHHPEHSQSDNYNGWDINQLKDLRSKGYSLKAIGEMFGVSGTRIHQLLKTN